jgi:endonuclease/exonuclease/phosphatase family metal-dependent hydrolase
MRLKKGAPSRIRTCDRRLRKPPLYPAELRELGKRQGKGFTTRRRNGPPGRPGRAETGASKGLPAPRRKPGYACGVRPWIPTAAAVIACAVLAAPGTGQSESGQSRSGNKSELPAGSPWRSLQACEAALVREKRGKGARKDKKEPRRVRIGTWNLRWFPDGRGGKPEPGKETDVRWMACTIAWMQVQALAVQEVLQNLRGRIAVDDLLDHLDRYTGGRWRAELDDCPDDGRQHVGLLFDSNRVRVEAIRSLPSINPGRNGCDRRLRPGFAAYLSFPGGADFHLLNVHLDSGVSGRDFYNRRKSWNAIGKAVEKMRKGGRDRDVVVLGDFNTMGCRKCAEEVPAEDEAGDLQKELGTGATGLRLLETTPGCTNYYRGRGFVLDQVLVSKDMLELARDPKARVKGICGQLECAKPGGGAVNALSRLSDHCPVVIEPVDEDLDQ